MSLADTQRSVLAVCRSLAEDGVPDSALEPIRRWATVDIWLEAAAASGVSPSSPEHESAPGKTPGAPDGGAKCVCGHSSHWHSHGGSGDCEAGPCDCKKFRPGMGL